MKRKNNQQSKPVQQDPVAKELAEILSESVLTPEPTPVPTPTPVPEPVIESEPVPLEVLVVEAKYVDIEEAPVSAPTPESEPEPVPTPVPEPVIEPESVPEPVSVSEPVPAPVLALIEDLQNQILYLHMELKEAKGKLAAFEAIFGNEGADAFMSLVAKEIIQEAKDAMKKTKVSVANVVVEKLRKYHKNPYAVNNPDF